MEQNKEIKYLIEKNISLLKKGISTNFLDPTEASLLESALKKIKLKYNIFKTYEECSKVIFYTDTYPNIVLLKISSNNIEHKHVLGTMFSLGINTDTFGDIVINEFAYIIVLNHIKDLVKANLSFINNKYVEVEEVSIDEVSNYKLKFEEINITVPSLRIDVVLAKLLLKSRNQIIDLISDKQIILNYNELKNKTYTLKEKDTFSVRKHGKFIFNNIVRTTKKDTFVLSIKKYI